MTATPRSCLQLPRPPLASCLFCAVQRDTRGASLSDRQRFNYYPSTPLPLISWVFSGTLHLVNGPNDDGPVFGPPLPRLMVTGPQRHPTASWSPGEVHALSVSFLPQAFVRLTGCPLASLIDRTLPLHHVTEGPFLEACQTVLLGQAGDDPFHVLQDRLQPLWSPPGPHQPAQAPYLRDWLRGMVAQAAHKAAGRGLRQMQRHIKNWTGQSQRDLEIYARMEQVMNHTSRHRTGSSLDLGSLAHDCGYADQSHMGRDIRRVTGLPPGRLDDLIQSEESFWFYRLIGQWFGSW